MKPELKKLLVLNSQAPCFCPQAAFRNETGRQPEKGSGLHQTA